VDVDEETWRELAEGGAETDDEPRGGRGRGAVARSRATDKEKAAEDNDDEDEELLETEGGTTTSR